MIRAARVDAGGIFQGVDELPDESALTGAHLAKVKECDLPAGKYKWMADPSAPLGGAFWPIEFLAKVEAARRQVQQEGERKAAIATAMRAGTPRRRAMLGTRVKEKK